MASSFKLEKTDVVDAEIEVLREMGVDIRCGVEVGKRRWTLRRELAFYVAIGCRAFYIAAAPGRAPLCPARTLRVSRPP